MRIAAYARFSSDLQRDASLDDQLRNCRTYCERQGWPAPDAYCDAAITGSRIDRPEYQRLLREAGNYDVIIIDDLTRLGRDKEEIGRAVKQLTFQAVRLIGVSDGVDTARKSSKLDVGMRGLMAEIYIDDLAEKTHRGQTGRVLAGASPGGLPYGYRVTTTGQREIDDEQAAIVRRIFAEYLAGHSARDIAAGLNADGITSGRGKAWAASAIHGDTRRGIGILANPMYAGTLIWNRSHWVKHPSTGRRVRKERPASEWLTADKPELQIISTADWQRTQQRLAKRRINYLRGKRPARYLLSGILRCGSCGGPLSAVNATQYGCSHHKDRGDAACGAPIRVNRETTEAAILDGIKQQLLSEAAFQRFQRAVTAALATAAPDITDMQARVTRATRARDNVLQAIRAGIITLGTKAEAERTEADLEAATAALANARAWQPAQILPRARDTWKRIAKDLATEGRTVPQTRAAIIEMIGNEITVHKKGRDFVAEVAASSASCRSKDKIELVAGAGFEPATFGL